MENYFILQLCLIFIIGGLFVTACTVAAEKFGSKIGGLIGGLPSTVVVTLFFIGILQSPESASKATDILPLIVGFSGLFLVLYVYLIHRGFWIALAGALSFWFILSLFTVLSGFHHFILSLLLYFVFLFSGLYLFEKHLNIAACEVEKIKFKPIHIILRGLFSGSVITLAVYLSKTCGEVLGGVFAVFPAVFISTLILSYRSRGSNFSKSLAKSLFISGMINVVVYGLTVRHLYPRLGLVLGTISALAITSLSAYGTYRYINKRMV